LLHDIAHLLVLVQCSVDVSVGCVACYA
jgi:hypothetical protein